MKILVIVVSLYAFSMSAVDIYYLPSSSPIKPPEELSFIDFSHGLMFNEIRRVPSCIAYGKFDFCVREIKNGKSAYIGAFKSYDEDREDNPGSIPKEQSGYFDFLGTIRTMILENAFKNFKKVHLLELDPNSFSTLVKDANKSIKFIIIDSAARYIRGIDDFIELLQIDGNNAYLSLIKKGDDMYFIFKDDLKDSMLIVKLSKTELYLNIIIKSPRKYLTMPPQLSKESIYNISDY